MSSFNTKYIWHFLAFLTIFDILHARKTSEPALVGLQKLEILRLQLETAFLVLF